MLGRQYDRQPFPGFEIFPHTYRVFFHHRASSSLCSCFVDFACLCGRIVVPGGLLLSLTVSLKLSELQVESLLLEKDYLTKHVWFCELRLPGGLIHVV